MCVPVQCACVCVCSSCVDVSTCHKYKCLDKLTGFVCEPVAKLCRLLPLLLTTVGPTSPFPLRPLPRPYLTPPSPVCHLIYLFTAPFSFSPQFYIELEMYFCCLTAKIKVMRCCCEEKKPNKTSFTMSENQVMTGNYMLMNADLSSSDTEVSVSEFMKNYLQDFPP